jgi:mono/diheme cytochrome c family protein
LRLEEGEESLSIRHTGRLVPAAFALVLLGLSVGSVTARRRARASQAAPIIQFQRTPARLARGRYLVNDLAHCLMCHSETDCLHHNCQPVPGMEGAGNVVPPSESGFQPPYRVVCPNITPDRKTGAGTWTDAQFVRALREGIGHDGRVLFPMMPYGNFRGLTDEDLASIIVYIRSIPAVHHPLPKTNVPKTIPVSAFPDLEATLPPIPPNASAEVSDGAYLVRIGNCSACHTPVNAQGRPLPGKFLAGGQVFEQPWGTFATANLTPDPTGISWYTEDIFIKTIRTGQVAGVGRKLNQFMPWSYYRHLSDADLKAIFAYLRTVKPVWHHVDNTMPLTYCCIDHLKHGLGYMNCPPYSRH